MSFPNFPKFGDNMAHAYEQWKAHAAAWANSLAAENQPDLAVSGTEPTQSSASAQNTNASPLSLEATLHSASGIQRGASHDEESKQEMKVATQNGDASMGASGDAITLRHSHSREIASKARTSSTPGKELFDSLRALSLEQDDSQMGAVEELRCVPNFSLELSKEVVQYAQTHGANWANELSGRFLCFMCILCTGTENEQQQASAILNSQLEVEPSDKLNELNPTEYQLFLAIMNQLVPD